jgi:hypothetical protein
MAISDDDDRSLCFDCERRVSVSVSVSFSVGVYLYIVSVRGGEVLAKNFQLHLLKVFPFKTSGGFQGRLRVQAQVATSVSNSLIWLQSQW